MTREELQIPGVTRFRPEVHGDERGSFMEILREDAVGVPFVQANHSRSHVGVLRGLHYHRHQADAWYVLRGRAKVGLADVRSPTVRAITVELAGDDPSVLYLPPGVAHGFYAETDLDLIYLVTHYYDNSDEFSLRWDDPLLGVPWGIGDPILSERDRTAPRYDAENVRRILAG